ncbi:MAG: PAS domain S-box protein [Bacteroidetes bacterium]|nr:PAS domain S-box protein [Bacteroidota bacterium]
MDRPHTKGKPRLEQLAARAATHLEDSFRAVFESSHDAMFLLTGEGFFDCNPRAMRIFGIPTRDVVLHIHPADISPSHQPDGTPSLPAALGHIRQALETGVDSFEWTHRRLNGESFPAHVLLSAFDFDGYRVLQATVRDITLQKRAEAELHDKKEELDRFFNLALDLLCIADTDGYFRHLNREWEHTLGYTMDELKGRRFLEFVHPGDMQATLEAISSLSKQQPVIDFTNRYRCKDGSYRWIEWRSAPAGNLIYAAARDITSHIEAQEALRVANESLAEANRELEAFSYSVSHDLRAPLRHIGGFVDLLSGHATEQLDEKGRRWLAIIAESARDMGQLIDDLLVFSRMGRSEMLEADCDLRAITGEIVEMLMRNAGARHVEWHVRDLPTVRGDPSMLRLALMNLLGNAFKYTRPRDPAVIEISATEEPGRWVVTVADNGIGFDMFYADKLFGIFQRLHSPKEYEGTGIGLANVQRIVRRHGGEVWADGAVDRGATFRFSLPRSVVPSTGT